MEVEDKTSPEETTKQKPIERVTVEEALKEKLIQLTLQANEAFQGMASITKSDVMNFILDTHADAFTRSELKTLKTRHFDELKFAQWITAQLKKAHANGDPVSIADLLAINPGLMEVAAKKPQVPKQNQRRSRASKNLANVDSPNEPALDEQSNNEIG